MEKYIGPDIEITKLTTFFLWSIFVGMIWFKARVNLNIPDSNGSNEGKIIYFYVIIQVFYPFSSTLQMFSP